MSDAVSSQSGADPEIGFFRGGTSSVCFSTPKAWRAISRGRREGGEWGGRYPLLSRLEGLGEQSKLFQRSPGRSAGQN